MPAQPPASLASGVATALDMAVACLRAGPDRPLIHYFDATLSVATSTGSVDALAAALPERGFRAGDRLPSTCRTCRSS